MGNDKPIGKEISVTVILGDSSGYAKERWSTELFKRVLLRVCVVGLGKILGKGPFVCFAPSNRVVAWCDGQRVGIRDFTWTQRELKNKAVSRPVRV